MVCSNWLKKQNINKWAVLISLGLTVIFFLISFAIYDAVYAINDDLMIESILSGTYFDNYPFSYYFSTELGVLLSGMYALFSSNPLSALAGARWLGIFFLGMYAFCLYVLLYRAIDVPEKVWDKCVMATASIAAYVFLFFESFVMLHYTLVAGSLGAIGIYLFITARRKQELKVPVAIFIFVYLIRVNVFFMLIPFVAIAFIFTLMREGISSFKSYLSYIAVFAGTFILAYVFNNMILLDEDWKAYKEINDIRTTVYDYTGIACDERAMDYYKEQGLSKEDIELYQSYDIMLTDRDVKSDLTLIGEYGYQRINETQALQQIKQALSVYKYRSLFQGIDAPYNYYYLFIVVFAAAVIIYSKKYLYLAILPMEILYRSFIWIYLIYKGRYPERVTQSILVMEIMFFIGIIVVIARQCKADTALIKGKLHYILKQGALIILVLSFIAGGVYKLRALNKDYIQLLANNKSADVVYSYMYDHPENLYFLDVYATVARTRLAVKDRDYHFENYMLLGGWIYENPVYKEKLNYMLLKDRDADKDKEADSNNTDTYKNIAELLKSRGDAFIIVKDGVGAGKEQLDGWIGSQSHVADTIISGDSTYYVYSWAD